MHHHETVTQAKETKANVSTTASVHLLSTDTNKHTTNYQLNNQHVVRKATSAISIT